MTADRPSVGPFPLEGSPEWRWGVWGRVVDGAFWPWRLEIRLKSRPCHHDEPPAGWRVIECDDSGAPLWAIQGDWDADSELQPETWNRTECHCWETLTSPNTEDIPPGGLTARSLRKLRLGNVHELLVEAARNDQLWELSHGHDTKRRVDEVVARAEASRAGLAGDAPLLRLAGPGRHPLPRDEHLRRLAALEQGMQQGHTHKTVANSLGLKTDAGLRDSLRWARREGLWQRSGRGVSTGPTPEGLAALQEYRATRSRQRDEHLRRLAGLAEGKQRGYKRPTVLRGLNLKDADLRDTLTWALDEGLWQRSGRGPTRRGLAAIQEWRARQTNRGDHD